MKIMSQMEAAKEGLARYYTGKPCKRGHDSERYVANGTCCQCHHDDQQARARTIQDLRAAAKARAEKQH